MERKRLSLALEKVVIEVYIDIRRLIRYRILQRCPDVNVLKLFSSSLMSRQNKVERLSQPIFQANLVFVTKGLGLI